MQKGQKKMNKTGLTSYTVNVMGDKVKLAEENGYHAYYSQHTNITAIEIKTINKSQARRIAEHFGRVLYIFE